MKDFMGREVVKGDRVAVVVRGELVERRVVTASQDYLLVERLPADSGVTDRSKAYSMVKSSHRVVVLE